MVSESEGPRRGGSWRELTVDQVEYQGGREARVVKLVHNTGEMEYRVPFLKVKNKQMNDKLFQTCCGF